MKPKYIVALSLTIIATAACIVNYQVNNPPGPDFQLVLGSHHSKTVPGMLELGDGKVSVTPEVGNIYSCQSQFNAQGGADEAAPWITGSAWNPAAKPVVAGAVKWKAASYKMSVKGSFRTIVANGLPSNSTSGVFPIASNDPAYQYDRNPNTIKPQSYTLKLPAIPTVSTTPSCVGMGMIGIATNGVAIFNGLDAEGRDAVAHEVQDKCEAHPQQDGVYHYHGPSECMEGINDTNTLVGYALDGFGIYSPYDASGKELTNLDLDACHGTTTPITWNGKKVSMYHYVLTKEYPYTIGCFMGTPTQSSYGASGSNLGSSEGNPEQANGMAPSGTPPFLSRGSSYGYSSSTSPNSAAQPPQAALDACTNKPLSTDCQLSTLHGQTISGTCRMTPSGSEACIPPYPPSAK